MYCKNKDIHAGPLQSFSYCATRDICMEDLWNYLNVWCYGPWQSGYALDLNDDCNAELVQGPDFTSNSMFDQQPLTAAFTLQAGQMCDVVVDATGFVAHIMFKGS